MILKTNSNDCDLGLILGAGDQGYQWMSERLGDLNRKWEINGGVCQNAGSQRIQNFTCYLVQRRINHPAIGLRSTLKKTMETGQG